MNPVDLLRMDDEAEDLLCDVLDGKYDGDEFDRQLEILLKDDVGNPMLLIWTKV